MYKFYAGVGLWQEYREKKWKEGIYFQAFLTSSQTHSCKHNI